MEFTIKNHLLMRNGKALPFRRSPNGGKLFKSRFLVIHYTAGSGFESTLRWFENPATQASAHLVIGASGEICQMQAFNKTCWHAGQSEWKTISGLNDHAIGIELDNVGVLQKNERGEWRSWFGSGIPKKDVLQARHRLGGPEQGWQLFTKMQVETCLALATALHAHYKFEDILGHDDISWPRKSDPGPAFPLAQIRSLVMGRRN